MMLDRDDGAPPVNNEPWFVPRSVGIGWRPAAWQGWFITAVAMAAVVATIVFVRRARAPLGIIAIVVILGVYFLVAATMSSRRMHADASARSKPVKQAELAEPPGQPPALVVDGLTKRFGERVAFQDVSFTVGVGEVFGFLGPNGAGKTTTVRTLGTLITPSSGSATVAGIPLLPGNGEAVRRRISIMPEAPGLYQRLSVRENLEFFAALFGVSDASMRIHRALEAVNLTSRVDDICASLSKGLRQRVALARALLNDPEILFLDEPTSGLDPVATRDVHALIDALRRRGVTIFLTTHRLEEAERLCDRVAILNTTLRMVGRPDELRARLFSSSLVVAVASPLADAGAVFGSVDGIEHWSVDDAGRYVLAAPHPQRVAPAVTRALVAAGADVLSIGELQHSLEDVYLQLISDDVEADSR